MSFLRNAFLVNNRLASYSLIYNYYFSLGTCMVSWTPGIVLPNITCAIYIYDNKLYKDIHSSNKIIAATLVYTHNEHTQNERTFWGMLFHKKKEKERYRLRKFSQLVAYTYLNEHVTIIGALNLFWWIWNNWFLSRFFCFPKILSSRVYSSMIVPYYQNAHEQNNIDIPLSTRF